MENGNLALDDEPFWEDSGTADFLSIWELLKVGLSQN